MNSDVQTQEKTYVFLHNKGLSGRARLPIIYGYRDELSRQGDLVKIPVKRKILFGSVALDGKYVTSDEAEAKGIRNTPQFKNGEVIELDPTNPDHSVRNTRLASEQGRIELERVQLIEKAKRYGMGKEELHKIQGNIIQLRERVSDLQDELAEKALTMARKSLDSVQVEAPIQKTLAKSDESITADSI